MSISEQIREHRTRLGLTQAQFAARIGVISVTVCRWETGVSRPSHLALAKIREIVKKGNEA